MVDLGHDIRLVPALGDIRVVSGLLTQNQYFGGGGNGGRGNSDPILSSALWFYACLTGHETIYTVALISRKTFHLTVMYPI